MNRGANVRLKHISACACLARVSRSVFGTFLVLLIGAMSLSSRALAQTVSVSGIAFPIDIVSRVGDDQLLVRLGGKETLIQKSQLERFAIEGTLGEPRLAERLELAPLLRFAEESFKTGSFEWAGLAFRAVRWRPTVIENDLVESLDVIADGNSLALGMETLGRTALRPIYEPERFQRVIARLVLAAGGRDPAWIRENGIAYVYGAERAIKERLQLELTERLRVRDVESGELLVRFAREVYGADDPIAQTVTARLDRFRNILKSVNNGDVEALGNLLATEIADRELSSLVGPLAMEGLHAAASRAFEAGDFEEALAILARVDTLKRTQTTHDLTVSVLTRISPRVGSVLQRPEVQNYLDFMARYDEGLGELYRRKLIESIDELLREQRASETEPLLDRLRTFSPPQESEIRSILARQARGYYAQGLYVLAERKLAESSSHGLGTVVLRCQLALAQMPSLVIGIFFAVVIVVSGLLLFYRRRGGAPQVDSGDSAAPPYGVRGGGAGEASIDSAMEDDDAPRGFVVNELRRLSPSAQEYQNCLAVLGLSANADVRTIKNTYRKLVKGVHPDRSKAHDEVASNRFIELTKTYDRILELRREFGYDD